MTAGPSLAEFVGGASTVLADAGVPSPDVDARELAAFVLGRDRLTTWDVREFRTEHLPEAFATRFAALVERRRLREPLQHLTARTTFRMLDVEVRPGVFVPRPETEVVAQHAIDAASLVADPHGTGVDGRLPLVVDLCCGSGIIALSVAWEVRGGARVVAVDASADAVALTTRNLEMHLDGDPPYRIEQGDVREGALLADLDGTVDVVVANPPYIPPDAVPNEPEVRDHDPDLALYGGGADGLEIPRAVVLAGRRLLRSGGVFVMEHAEVQAEAVRAITAAAGFVEVSSFSDLTHRPRGVRAVAP